MTFAPVGSILQTSSTTFTLTPANTGDLILFEFINTSDDTTHVTGVSSSNATWSIMGTSFAGSGNAQVASVWAAKVTSTSPATVTVSWSAATPTIRAAGQEFSSTAGSWALDVQGHVDLAGGTNTWASLSPAAAHELYFGYAFNSGSASNGSTSGYTYQSDSHGNGMAYNADCSASAQAPVWADSGQVFGVMVLVKETGGGTPHTATASLTVTPSFASKKGLGKLQAMTVRPAFAMTKGLGLVQAMTVRPAFANTVKGPQHGGAVDRHHRGGGYR